VPPFHVRNPALVCRQMAHLLGLYFELLHRR
jgi:hypothetical protein